MAVKVQKPKALKQSKQTSPLLLSLGAFRVGLRLPQIPASERAYHLRKRIGFLQERKKFLQPIEQANAEKEIRKLQRRIPRVLAKAQKASKQQKKKAA